MRWAIEYVESDNYVKVTCEGVFSIEENSACLKNLVSSPFWKPGMSLLFDNRNFDFGKIDLDKMRTASNIYGEFSKELGLGKVALLMKSLLNYGLGRQFQMLSENKGESEIQVFNDEKEALEWLTKSSEFQPVTISFKEQSEAASPKSK